MSGRFYPIITLALSIHSFSLVNSQSFTLLKDINPGVNGSGYFDFTAVGSQVFFRPDDGVHGDELWKSNGTASGTVLVKDINPGNSGSDLQEFINVNGTLYFRADDGVHGSELWKSDGTESGTVMVKDIQPGFGSGILSTFFVSNGVLYFQADDGVHGSELWKSDGTADGTIMLKDLYPGKYPAGMQAGTPYSGNPNNFTTINNLVYFAASNGDETHQVWKTDGTIAGTSMVTDIYPGIQGYTLNNFVNFNGNLFFTVYSGAGGDELWKSDGTSAGTVLVKSMPGGNFSIHPAVMNNTLYFLEGDGLWKSDGTTAGTELIKQKGGTFALSPELLTVFNGSIYFTGNDDEHGLELWKSDGTASGTSLLKDIYEGSTSSDINSFVKIGNTLMFTANNGINGTELWVTDGTVAGTKMVQDFQTGSEGSMPAAFYEVRGNIIEGAGRIFAGVSTSGAGNEVWTAPVTANASLPVQLLEFKTTLDGNDGLADWKTDNEYNTSVFEVQRSVDAVNYNTIGTVLAANSPGVHDYAFKDYNVKSLGVPVIYYRLRQVDGDGKFSFSNIATIRLEEQMTVVSLYPNPVTTNLNLTITSYQAQKLHWRFTDKLGRLIRMGTYTVSPGINYISEEVGFVSTGVYYLQVFNGTDLKQVFKVLKQ
jgi:ELWxxDGT repeat protein